MLGLKPTKTDLQADLLEAYRKVGGVAYLVTLASLDPRSFVGLLSKVMPLQLSGSPGGEPIRIEVVTGVPRCPEDPDMQE